MGLADLYNQQYGNSMASPVQASSGSGGGGASGAGIGGATVTAGLLSGLTDIATTFVNAGRAKNLAKFNAGMAEIEGRMAKVAARFEIAGIRRRSEKLFSRQRALYAKAGVKLEGSPAEVMLDSLKEAELDAAITDINAEYIGWQKRTEGDIGKMQVAGVYGDAMMKTGAKLLNMGTNYLARG